MAGGKADDQPLALIPVGDALSLRSRVEVVRPSVSLTETRQMVQMQHLDAVLCMEPQNLVTRRP
eukprot:2348491-Prymnesium_polylepis.1